MSNRIFVGGLSSKTDEIDFEDVFKEFGEVEESMIVASHEGSRFPRFGIVRYTNVNSVEQAILNMNDSILDGKKITVRKMYNSSVAKSWILQRKYCGKKNKKKLYCWKK